MRHIKVLAVINGLGTGGAERSLAEMLPGLERVGIDVTVACFYRRDAGVEESVLHRDRVRFISSARLAGRVRALRRIVTHERPDVVHTIILESHLTGRLASIGRHVVVLSSLVNTPYAEARTADPRIGSQKLNAVRLADGLTARHLTDHFHAITHAVKAHAIDSLHIDAARITVVERGRDRMRLGSASQERRARARRALGLDDDAEVAVCLGREDYQKGHRYLLEATAHLARTRPNLVTVVAGRRGTESDALGRDIARLGLGDRFRRLGHRDDAPELLAAADVFVFPSLFEGLGGSLIEAMALSLPIVASDIPAIREVVEDGRNATLVAPRSGEAIASAVSALLDSDPLRSAYGRRSRTIFEERFTLERSTAGMADLYRRLVTEPRSRFRAETGAEEPERKGSGDERSDGYSDQHGPPAGASVRGGDDPGT